MRSIILFTVFAVIIPLSLVSQSIITDPEYPTDVDEVLLTVDVTGTPLEGYNGKMYAHCGVTVNGNQWQHVIGQWGNNETQPELTNIGGNQWQLLISPSIRAFWGVPDNDTISEMCFVFRSEDAYTQTGDMFVNVYASWLTLVIDEPQTDWLMVHLNDEIPVEAISPAADSLFLFVNNELQYETDMVTLSYTITADNFGSYWSDVWVKIVAKNAVEMVADSFAYQVIPEPDIEELPEGMTDGINYVDDNTVILSLYAPEKQFAFVIGDFNNWEVDENYYMKQTPDGERFWLQINDLTAGQEYIFQYYVDGEIKIGDPYADKVSDPWNDQYISNVTYPDLIDYPSGMTTGIATVLQTAQQPYGWQVENFTPPAVEDMVVYECLIRDFVGLHSYAAMADTIGYLKKLGVNVLELMPVNEFEGNISWGYNPNYYFAPDKYYGPKDNLKALIDTCHQNGIAVVLDIALNHSFGTSPMVLLYWDSQNNRPAENNPWYNQEPRHDFNVGYDFNHESPQTKAFVKRVTKYWLEEYKFDGFRFDLSKGFTQTYTVGNTWLWGQYDQSRIDIWNDYSSAIWEVKPDAYVILEHFAENSEEKVLSNMGMLLWGNLNGPYLEGSMGWTENGKSNIEWISYQKRGWNDPHVVGFMESHDEERLMFKNIAYGRSFEDYDISDTTTGLQRAALAATFFFTIPGPKMIWQFGEMGYDYSIEYNGRTGPKPIKWNYLNDWRRNYLFHVYAALIQLKTEYDVFRTTDFSLDVYNKEKVVVLRDPDMDVVVVGNFGMDTETVTPDWPETGKWYEFFTQTELQVDAANQSLNLQRGEYRLYSTVEIEKPEWLNTGIDDNNVTQVGFSNVYPNPSAGTFTFTFDKAPDQSVDITVFDMLGNLVARYDQIDTPSFSWDPHGESISLKPGFYFAKINSGNHNEIIKLIIE